MADESDGKTGAVASLTEAVPPPQSIEPPLPPASVAEVAASPRRTWRDIPHLDFIILLGGSVIAALFFLYASPPANPSPPIQTELPFDAFAQIRQWTLDLAAQPNSPLIVAGIVALLLAIIWFVALRKARITAAISASTAVICVGLALQAQSFLMQGKQEAGAILYAVAAVSFGIWVFFVQRSDRRDAATRSVSAHPTRRVELTLLALVMLVTVFARFYDIKRLPYGVDGDESIWTNELVSSRIDGENTLSSVYHYRNLPMSYWLQTPFHWLFGPGLTAARLEVAFFSVLASLVFYYLARELFDVPTALIAVLLLAVSLPDLSASRTANIQAHFKLWAILPFLGIVVALRTRRLRDYFLTGLACAGGMLLYESLLPPIAAMGLFAFLMALREWRDWRAWIRRFAVLAAPMAVAALITVPYLFGRDQYYSAFRGVAEQRTPIDQVLSGLQGVFASFYQSPQHDALFNRSGPYINGLLVPLLVLGIAYAVATLKRPSSWLLLLWILAVFFPVPIYLAAPLPRLYYAALPALYLLIALALIAVYRSIAAVIQMPYITVPIGAALLGVFALYNLTIWFQEVHAPDEALLRRQVAEIVAKEVDPNSVLLMPYDDNWSGEPVLVEQNLMGLLIRERRGVKDAGEYRAVPLSELLPLLALEGPQHREVKVLYDFTQDPQRANRQQIIEALQRCYPKARVDRYTWFELYHLTQTDLNLAECRSALLFVEAAPPRRSGDPTTISWSLDPLPASQANLVCSRQDSRLIWKEAESFGPQNGWIVDSHFVVDWSGEGYLADAPGSQTATSTITVPQDGTYSLGMRSYRRQDDPFPAYLDFNGQRFEVAQAALGINQWNWQSLGEVNLISGTLPLTLTRPWDDTAPYNYMALFIDTLVLSPAPQYDPAHDQRWLPVLTQTQNYPNRSLSGQFELPLEAGQYRCEVQVEDGQRLVDKTGTVGIRSQLMFDVK